MDQAFDSLEIFVRSMERAIVTPRFVERFYERFTASGDGIAAAFAHSDMKRQVQMAKASLYHVLRAAQGSADGHTHLEDLGRLHARRHDVRPEHYDVWLDSLIATAKETNPSFDATTEAAWRLHLGRAIHAMQKR